MAGKKVWDIRHMHYKDRDKRIMCWQSMGEAMNTSVGDVQRKIHNLRNQVSNHFPYCVLCVKWAINLYIALRTWTCEVSCQACVGMVVYLGSVLGFLFSVWTKLYAVQFQLLFTFAHVSCNWSIIFILALYGKVKWPKTKYMVVCWAISIINLGQSSKKGESEQWFYFSHLCRYRAYSLLH